MANAQEPQLSGLAASIRAATESTTFDLAGHSAQNIRQTVQSAFSAPFSHLLESDVDMIRITFVVGAGKLSRQKYDEKAMQTVTSSLRDVGYEEDRGASCVRECGGCFKTQHDTGKNLFTVVVFPNLGEENGGDGGAGGSDGGAGAGSSAQSYPLSLPLEEGTPTHIILLTAPETFAKNIPSTCPSWSEKKSCSEVLKQALDTIEAMDAKLMTGTPLSEDEQEFYEAIDSSGGGEGASTSINKKIDCIKKLMQAQVESGELTSPEKDKLISQVTEKIDNFNKEIEMALQKGQEKKAAKLTAQKEKAESRKTMLESHSAQEPHKLKFEPQIVQLKKKLAPLLKLEQTSKGRLLSMKETKELAQKEEILGEIEELEMKSRGWFEEDEDFEKRLEVSRKKKIVVAQSKSKSGSGGGAGKKAAVPSWVTPGGLAAKQAALGKKSAGGKAKPKSGGGVFAAMMMDSDSDSD